MGRWVRREPCEARPPSCPSVDDEVAPVPSLNPSLSTEGPSQGYQYIWKGATRTVNLGNVSSGIQAETHSPAFPTPMKDYEDKLAAIDFCQRGFEKADIAKALGRSEHWVKRWWKQTAQSIPKPKVMHAPLVQNAPIRSFRDLELKRGFAPSDDSFISTLATELHWEPARRATRSAETGELRVRFDSAGNSMTQPGRFVAEYKGGVAALDELLQRTSAAAGIRDPGSRVFLNRYESGCATCPTHRHDFWTAMVSFGVERVALIEESPLLLSDGDLLIFGTQSHGCPEMPQVSGRRFSVVVFFRPDADNLDRRWTALRQGAADLVDEEDDAALERNSAERSGSQDKLASKMSVDKLVPKMPAGLGTLVDHNLCGCPGISLGMVGRRNLRVSDPVKIFSVGSGRRRVPAVLDELRSCSVDSLWDIRCSLAACSDEWGWDGLRQICHVHGLRYHHVALGRREAGGIRQHLLSEEGWDTLARIVSEASEGRGVALLGEEESWTDCKRYDVATALSSGIWGPVDVIHMSATGVEAHPIPEQLPSWLSSFAAELSQRRSGEAVGTELRGSVTRPHNRFARKQVASE